MTFKTSKTNEEKAEILRKIDNYKVEQDVSTIKAIKETGFISTPTYYEWRKMLRKPKAQVIAYYPKRKKQPPSEVTSASQTRVALVFCDLKDLPAVISRTLP